MTLVDEAKAHRPGSLNGNMPYPYSVEEIQLAVAWANDEIGLSQVSQVMGRIHGVVGRYPSGKTKRWGGVHCFLAMSIREAVRRGLLGDSYL